MRPRTTKNWFRRVVLACLCVMSAGTAMFWQVAANTTLSGERRRDLAKGDSAGRFSSYCIHSATALA